MPRLPTLGAEAGGEVMGKMIENPRNHVMSFRVSDDERQAIRGMKPDGVTLCDFLRTEVMTAKQSLQAAPEALQAEEFDDAEILTWAVSIGMTQLMILRKKLPEHARNARKIKAVEEAIFNLAAGHGKPLDDKMIDYVIGCWNRTMQEIQLGLEPVRREAA
jgi:hypothetical protein